VFNELIEPVTPSIDVNLPLALDVNEFNELVLVSNAVNLPEALLVNEFKLPVDILTALLCVFCELV
jgi:hypothetical protein